MIHTYYTPTDSATGLKLTRVAERIRQAKEVEMAFMRLYGIKDLLPAADNIVGGLTIAEINIRPSMALWLPYKAGSQIVKNGYYPNGSTVAGKALIDEIALIPVVRKAELLRILGLPVNSYHVPHVDVHDQKSFIRYRFDDKWYSSVYKCPQDCVKQI